MATELTAIDMDDTLLLPDHIISSVVKNAIVATRARGVNAVLTTGHPYVGVHSYLKELHMGQLGGYCIIYNNTLVQKTTDGSTVAQTTLSYDDHRFLEKLSYEVDSHFRALSRIMLYATSRSVDYYTVHESFVTTILLVFCETGRMDPNVRFLKVIMIGEPAILDQTIMRIPQEVREKYTVLKGVSCSLETLDRRISEDTGVKSLAGMLDIEPEEIMATGDQRNDIAVVEYAGVGVATDNAILSVKGVADFVIKSNFEDGVTFAIERYMLN